MKFSEEARSSFRKQICGAATEGGCEYTHFDQGGPGSSFFIYTFYGHISSICIIVIIGTFQIVTEPFVGLLFLYFA